MMVTRGAVNFSDAWKSRSDIVEGLTNPRPPNLTGRAEFPDQIRTRWKAG